MLASLPHWPCNSKGFLVTLVVLPQVSITTILVEFRGFSAISKRQFLGSLVVLYHSLVKHAFLENPRFIVDFHTKIMFSFGPPFCSRIFPASHVSSPKGKSMTIVFLSRYYTPSKPHILDHYPNNKPCHYPIVVIFTTTDFIVTILILLPIITILILLPIINVSENLHFMGGCAGAGRCGWLPRPAHLAHDQRRGGGGAAGEANHVARRRLQRRKSGIRIIPPKKMAYYLIVYVWTICRYICIYIYV